MTATATAVREAKQAARAATGTETAPDGDAVEPADASRGASERTPEAAEPTHPLASTLGREIAQRVGAARRRGYSRRIIADAAGLTQSVIGRIQKFEYVKPLEIRPLTVALERIESGEIKPTTAGRPRSRFTAQSKLNAVREILANVPDTADPLEYRSAVESAVDVIDGSEEVR